MNKPKYIFATDVDGTLLMDNHKINKTTLEAFKLANEKGHIVVIATGRSIVRTKPLLEMFPCATYLICNNGAVVYDVKNDKEIYIANVNPIHYIKITDFAREHNIPFKMHTNKDWIGWGAETCGTEPTPLDDELDSNIREHIKNNPNDTKLFNNQVPTQLSIRATKEFCTKYFDQFKSWFGNDSSVFLTNSIYLDVNPKDVSKWTGLVELANYLNIDKTNIVTFGDSGNDLEMIVNAKENGFALANAKDDLKMVVKPKIGSNNTDAIGKKILEYIN